MSTPPLWSWHDLCVAVGAPVTDGPDVLGVDIDSRQLKPGSLFVALPGERPAGRDGHDFVASAFSAGASGALVARDIATIKPYLRVGNTLAALRAIATAARNRTQARCIAVTGSSGKTTLKGMLAAALAAHASEGSFNNHIGVPLTLARMPAQTSVGVFEIGTNHPGEISPLSRLVRPDVAVLLNVLPAHVGNFDGLTALRAEKLCIADGLAAGGTLVLHEDIESPSRVRTCVRFGTSEGADARLLAYADGVARLRVAARDYEVQVPGGGAHRALTLLAALTVINVLGGDIEAAIAHITASAVPTGRGNRHVIAGICVIDDSYNANPASMAASLRTLLEVPARRRLAILGDIMELGAAEAELHRGLRAACDGLDGIYCVGPRMQALATVLPEARLWNAAPAADAIDVDVLARSLAAGDVVLVKASKAVFWVAGFVPRLLAAIRRVHGG